MSTGQMHSRTDPIETHSVPPLHFIKAQRSRLRAVDNNHELKMGAPRP